MNSINGIPINFPKDPTDITRELNDIKARLEMLEARVLTMGTNRE
jgi:hypothetical protein